MTAYTYVHYIGKCFKVHVTMIGCLSQPATHTNTQFIQQSMNHQFIHLMLISHLGMLKIERIDGLASFNELRTKDEILHVEIFRAEFVVPELFEFMYFGFKKRKKCVYMFAS